MLMLVAAVFVENHFTLSVAPGFEKVFEDMLGSKEKLPTLARCVLDISRFQQDKFLPLLLPVALVFGLLWWQRRNLWAKVVCGALALGLVAFTIVGFVGLQLPLVQLIQSLDGPVSGVQP